VKRTIENVEMAPDLRDRGAGGGVSGFGQRDAVDFQESVALKGLVRSVTGIETLRGSIGVAVPACVETVTFEKVEAGAVRRVGGVQVTLQSVGANEPCDLGFQFTGVTPEWVRIVGRDSQGGAVERSAMGMSHSDSSTDGNVIRGSKYVSLAKRPASVAVSFVAKAESIEYRFQFDKIPLPAHASMPEKLPPLESSRREAPVTLEFLRMAGKPNFPEVELRAVNHANKAVRKLEMRLTFFDAAGNKLEESPSSHLGRYDEGRGLRILVVAGASGTFQTQAFFAPKETHRAVARVERIEFTDATAWKPGGEPPGPGKP
jgi:hypothetical protein